MKQILKGIILMLMCWAATPTQAQDFSSIKNPQDWVTAKNYYLTYVLLQDTTALYEYFSSDRRLTNLLDARHNRLLESEKCTDLACLMKAFMWKNEEIEYLSATFSKLVLSHSVQREHLKKHLFAYPRYGNIGNLSLSAYIEKALRQDFHAMNYAIRVYGGGEKPNYPTIDSIAFNTNDPHYLSLLKEVRVDVLSDIQKPEQAFQETLLCAIRLLEINERWDAAQLEPLRLGENKAALDAIATTDFSRYPYSLLLTLGAGPEVYGQPVSPGGMLRSRTAARSYFAGLAPFIVVSGGRVHPYKTLYIEAQQMKKYLMEVCQVPEHAILIDPYARHTTTNLRNTARILLSYGFPTDQYAIVNSSSTHIDAVENMAARCIRELGYLPYELGNRVSDVIIEFKPREESFTIDPDEPLDP
ncbi:YdcF family protein [Sphingobacterium corticis]|uniref:YdcF family protein n=1 Tax=Sphingobacterium corticis TaxID=1812823 RepID=A0ABW5NL86_9SPHI